MKDENKVSYAVCTEASDYNFPYVRTMLKSLLKHDRWLKDNIVIFTCNLTPLSNHNRSILKEMLPNIKFSNIRSNIYSELKIKGYEKKEVLLNLYKLEIFKLKDVDLVLYINSYSLIVSTLMKLFEGKSDAILPKLDTSFVNPKTLTKPAVSSSVMMVSKECLDKKNHNQILDYLKSQKNVDRKEIDESIYSILSGYDINHWENQVIKKSKYVDSKYKQFLAIQDSVSVIHMDIELNTFLKKSSHFMYRRINSLWKQCNEDESWVSLNSIERGGDEKIKKIVNKKEIIPKQTFSDRLAVYTTADEGYIKHAIVSFQTFKDKNPDLELDFFIISKKLKKSDLDLLSKNSINHIRLNLSSDFKVEKDWPYPSECFWLFKGPEILSEMNYKYSMYIDCDVQCNQPMDLNWITSLELIAGANRGVSITKFLSKVDNINTISKGFNINFSKVQNSPSINTGVLFFNNHNYSKLKFYDKALNVFKLSKKLGIPRKGDDSLLCLLMAIYSNYSYTDLPASWNNYKFYIMLSKRENHYDSILIHHAQQKPWKTLDLKYKDNPYVNRFIKDWNNVSKKLKEDGKL